MTCDCLLPRGFVCTGKSRRKNGCRWVYIMLVWRDDRVFSVYHGDQVVGGLRGMSW